MGTLEREKHEQPHDVQIDLPHLPSHESLAPPLDERSEEVFTDEIHDFLGDIERNTLIFKQKKDSGEAVPNVVQAAVQKLYADRVVHAEYQELSKLSEALYFQLFLPQFETKLNEVQPRWLELLNQPRNKAEKEEFRLLSAQRQHWRYEISYCNQALLDAVEFSADRQVNPAELAKAIHLIRRDQDPRRAEGYVRGMQAEIAAAHCIADSGREVTYSTIEQDMEGKDIWVASRINKIKIGYDVKCSPMSSRYGTEKENAIFVDPSWLDGYQIRPEFRQQVIDQL